MTAAKKPEADAPPPAEITDDIFAGLVPGRIVHYHPTLHEARSACEGPWPAMVTRVGKEIPGEVTLNVNMPVPTPIGTDPVQRREKVLYGAKEEYGCWAWMWPGQAGYRSDPPSALPELKP